MLLWDAVQRRERNSVRQWTNPPLLLGAGKGATTSLHISPKGAWMRQLCRDMAGIINTISLCCYRWTNISLVGVQLHCSLQPKPAACRLLQPMAVLSAQIITKDRPPSKKAFQMNHSLLVFPRKKCSNSEISKPYQRHLQDRGSFWNPNAKTESSG